MFGSSIAHVLKPTTINGNVINGNIDRKDESGCSVTFHVEYTMLLDGKTMQGKTTGTSGGCGFGSDFSENFIYKKQ